nr:hypothetical protein CFP56_11654 [Quercus suber]
MSQTYAAVAPRATTYPFNRLIAFGDELSDNGNGSYAHGITGSPANVYGFGTWTDGAVAVSYLADLLHVPLTDYAFGGCCGAASGGATIDNTYTAASAQYKGAPVPSIHDQIYKNYTGKGTPSGITKSLQFLWPGLNDVSQHTDAFYAGDPNNALFAANMSTRILADAEYLIQKGAPYVFVANIYPKHLAPVTKKYLCSDGGCVATWGQIISSANAAIKSKLAASKFAKRIIYYDVYTFMINVMNNKNSYGLTESLADFCDGDGDVMWQKCISGSYTWQGAEKFYWMNFIQPTTHVYRLIAADMKSTIDKFLSK